MIKNLVEFTHDKANKTSVLFSRFVVAILIIIISVIRIWVYGNPNLSISGNDTITYIQASQVPLFSSEMMTGRRLLGTNLIYKVLEPKDGYQVIVNGSIDTTSRDFQPGLNRIAILQLILSVAGWAFFAFVVSEHLTNLSMKLVSVFIILLFAFTPQMADWDSILMSESLTFSLFALQLALLVKLVFSLYKGQGTKIFPYFAAWVITFFIWTFLRDTNLFASLVTIGMGGILLLAPKYRGSKYLYGALFFTIAIFAVGAFTSGNSTRSLVQIVNIYNDDLLKSEEGIVTLTMLGMPEHTSAAYPAWFQKNAKSTLIKYMFIHPGYPATKIFRDFPFAFTEIKQTYFHLREHKSFRNFLMNIGDTLHPENTTPFLANILLLFGLILLAVKNTNQTSRPWAWIAVWLFLTAGITLIPTILGDTWALNRHALFSTMIYRMCMWLFAIIVMDIAIAGNDAVESQQIQHH